MPIPIKTPLRYIEFTGHFWCNVCGADVGKYFFNGYYPEPPQEQHHEPDCWWWKQQQGK